MSTFEIAACAITWTAVAIAVWSLGRARKARVALLSGERCGSVKPTFFVHGQSTECVLRPRHSGGHKDEYGTRWRLIPAAAKDGEACDAYQLPTTPTESGLCARCGMYDYKHQEATDA